MSEKNLRTSEQLAAQVGESREQIRRFIRLTNLLPEILDMVDNSVLKEKDKLQMALRPAVELSYLTEDEQKDLLETILIADPEGEYAPLIDAMDGLGTVVRVAAGGKDRLNAMYMVDGYGENNPIVVKSQFIMSLVERIDPNGVGAKQKSIIDRCTAAVYEDAEQTGTVPTLTTLREKLMEQPEDMAREIALALELFKLT